MVIVNTFFKKKREHLITYSSRGRCSQIGYFLYKRIKLVEVMNCKVIPVDYVAPHHRLLCMELGLKRERKAKAKEIRKIKWYKLVREGDKIKEFKRSVLEGIDMGIEDVQERWTQNAAVMRRHGEELLRETSSIIWEEKESWWWSEGIEKVIKDKEANKMGRVIVKERQREV
ncbi:uncharacterized protein [Palaemon carinicauda]|uniref:uncharacterized protein n=1 Tax=Palaemon carinicauda TaxID=392227 RepID=UPI0035B5F9E2